MAPSSSLQPEPPSLRAWGYGVLALAGATLAGLLLEPHTALLGQALLYVLAVVLVAYSQPWVTSLSCAIAAVAAFNFFFVPPRWTFQVDSNENLVALLTMSIVALVIRRLSANLRSETQRSALHAQRAQQLQMLATALSNAASQEAIAALGRHHLDISFAGPNYLALRSASGTLALPPGTPTGVADGLACCMNEAACLGPGTGRWPGLNAWYLPLGERSATTGAMCVQPAPASDSAGREHSQAMASLLAQALTRLQLQSGIQNAQIEVQRQQTQSTLLAAIAHDLRTPLASVIGGASMLQTQSEKLGPTERQQLLQSILQEASYLSEVTENTLQLMQLTHPTSTAKHQWESMEEIVGTVLARVRQRDTTRRIRSKVPAKLPLIKADPVLLAQLLTNLLDNALKYSAGAIELSVTAADNTLCVAVKDHGPGIPADKQEAIFAPYARGDQAGARGSGLGLAVCRAIAKVHGGSLTVRSRPAVGSTFMLTLPVEAAPAVEEPL